MRGQRVMCWHNVTLCGTENTINMQKESRKFASPAREQEIPDTALAFLEQGETAFRRNGLPRVAYRKGHISRHFNQAEKSTFVDARDFERDLARLLNSEHRADREALSRITLPFR